jgi:hypothetical protein
LSYCQTYPILKGENTMKKYFAIFIMTFFATFYAFNFANAGVWDKCKVCHNGNIAPDQKTLKDKYQTADTLIKAAKESLNPMMKNYKGDEELKEAAKDLGLK